ELPQAAGGTGLPGDAAGRAGAARSQTPLESADEGGREADQGKGTVKNAAVVLLLLAVAVWVFVRARPPRPQRTLPAASTVRPTAPPLPPVTAPAEPPPAVSPDDSRTEELLRDNAGLEPDPDLLARYRDIDARYFGRALPAASLRWEPRLAEVGTTIAENFRLEGATDGHLIILNPDIRANPQELQRALCHEMVHVAVWTQDRGHGPVLQRFL